MYSVLFICTANICRSPMAMGLLRKQASQNGESEEWRIDSAGTWAPEGEQAAQGTRAVLRKRGIAIDTHRSRSVDRELIEGYQLVLVMEQSHKEALMIEFPDLRERIYLLAEMAGQSYNIADPIGGSLVEFEETAQEIEQLLSDGYKRIRKLAKEACKQ